MSTQQIPRVSVVTSHGRKTLDASSGDKLLEVMKRAGVPWSAVSAYATSGNSSAPALIPSLDATLDSYSEASEILLYFNRNVNPFIFSNADYFVAPSDNPEEAATEYFYQDFDNNKGSADLILKQLSPDECKTIVANRVAETIERYIPHGETIVVGISGGGDSNALLQGLSKLTDRINLDLVILKGIPDWDAGVPRAQELCDRFGLPLTVISAGEVKESLGIPASDPMSLVDRFEAEFEGDDFEFMGTLLIRLGLSRRARELGTSYICTGLNLEDILTEAISRLASGKRPAAFPLRAIDDVNLVMPLWLCPKRIIDGCYPKYSLDNYEARYPCFSLGRNLYYSVVYNLQSEYPGFTDQLVQGLSRLSLENPVSYEVNAELGFPVEGPVPLPLIRQFKRMLGSHA